MAGGRKRNQLWAHFEKKKSTGRAGCYAVCRKCQLEMRGTIDKLALHYNSCIENVSSNVGADTFSDDSLSYDIPQAKKQRAMSGIVCSDIGRESNEASTSGVKTVSDIVPMTKRDQRAERRMIIKEEILDERNEMHSIVDEKGSTEICISDAIIIDEDTVDSNISRSSGIEPEAACVDIVLNERDQRALRRLKIKEEILDECNEVHSIVDEKGSAGICMSGAIIIDEDTVDSNNPEAACVNVVLNERDQRALRRVKIKEEMLDEPTMHIVDCSENSPTSTKKVISQSKIKKETGLKRAQPPLHQYQNSKDFFVGGFVYAKLKGFRPWPAQILSINKTSCEVRFYGTHDYSKLSVCRIYRYCTETKKIFSSKVTSSKVSQLYQSALNEIEDEMKK